MTGHDIIFPVSAKFTTVTNAAANYGYCCERSIFKAVGRTWIFYNKLLPLPYLYCSSSTDNGATWEAETQLAALGGVYQADAVWVDGNRLHYTRIDSRAVWVGNQKLYYRSGILNSDGSVSWTSAEQILRTLIDNDSQYYAQNLQIITDENHCPAVFYVWGKEEYYYYNYHWITLYRWCYAVIRSSTDDGIWNTAYHNYEYRKTDDGAGSGFGRVARMGGNDLFVIQTIGFYGWYSKYLEGYHITSSGTTGPIIIGSYLTNTHVYGSLAQRSAGGVHIIYSLNGALRYKEVLLDNSVIDNGVLNPSYYISAAVVLTVDDKENLYFFYIPNGSELRYYIRYNSVWHSGTIATVNEISNPRPTAPPTCDEVIGGIASDDYFDDNLNYFELLYTYSEDLMAHLLVSRSASTVLPAKFFISKTYDFTGALGLGFYWWGSGVAEGDQNIEFQLLSSTGGWVAHFADGDPEWKWVLLPFEDRDPTNPQRLIEVDLGGSRADKAHIESFLWTCFSEGLRRLAYLCIWYGGDLKVILTVRQPDTADLLAEFIIKFPSIVAASELSSATGFNNQRKLVRASDGTLYATYSKQLATKFQIYVAKSVDDGATWTDETRISAGSMSSYNQYEPFITVDSNDYLHVVWTGYAGDTDGFQIYYAKYTTTWSNPIRISIYTGMNSYHQFGSSIAVDSNDYLHVVWGGGADGFVNDQIWYAKYKTSWITPMRISTYSDMNSYGQASASIAVDYSGYIHVVWSGRATGYTTHDQIWYAKYTNVWGAPVRISTLPTMESNTQYDPCIAVDSNSFLYVSWMGWLFGSFSIQIWCTKYTNVWAAPSRVSTADGMDLYDQLYPSIAVDSNNYRHVIWQGKATGYTDYTKVWYAKYKTSWGDPLCIQVAGQNQTPNIRWSAHQASNRITTRLEYVFTKGTASPYDVMFNFLSLTLDLQRDLIAEFNVNHP